MAALTFFGRLVSTKREIRSRVVNDCTGRQILFIGVNVIGEWAGKLETMEVDPELK